MDDVDAIDLARITFSPIAKAEAKQLVARAASGATGSTFPIVIRPPFEGPTRLVVRGKRIRIGKFWAFLAFIIESCSAPMPFSHLGYNRQNPGNQGRKKNPHAKPAYRGSFRKAIQSNENDAVNFTQAIDPSSMDVPQKISGILNSSRYTATFTHGLEDRGVITHMSASSVYDDVMASNGVYSSGTGVPGSHARAASFAEVEERGLSASLADFKNMISLLTRAGPNVRILSVENRAFARVAVPGDPLGPAWAFLDSYARRLPRRAIVALVSIADRCFAVIEIERRPKAASRKREEYFRTALLSPPTSRSITPQDERAILDSLISTRGVIGRDWRHGPFRTWLSNGLWHIDQTSSERADRLYEALVELQ